MIAGRGLVAGLLGIVIALSAGTVQAKSTGLDHQGRLDAFDKEGKSLGACPLGHTDVKAEISGFIARVTVRQEFHNPRDTKIEAVYVFPLSENAAVDRMTMQIGDRVIDAEIHPRRQARRIYEQARAAGHVASLLDQERPNIFTQSVANIEPGAEVQISLSYSETLPWKDGLYEFVFPMVVGPRYIPGAPAGPKELGFAAPTAQVPDAARLTPKPPPPGKRAGHDIAVTVSLDAGLPIRHLESKQHEIDVDYPAADRRRAVVKLRNQAAIPNRDFVLEYQTASDKIEDTLLTHTDSRGKFFTLILQPPKRVRKEQVVPKELVFVIDKSGSMSGFPIETAKEAMRRCIEGLHERDTFNLMTFEGGVGFCFDKPVPNTVENRRKALDYLGSLQGSGGTEMMAAIRACLAGQDDPERLRVVCFMTDGYVGNDKAIIDAVRASAGRARVFAFGIGTAVNRYLLDGMAKAGRGEVHYILNQQQAEGAAERFYERIRAPVLTDIRLDFGDLTVEEVFPTPLPDLFSVKPLVLKGRYRQPGKGTVTLRGRTGEGAFERKIEVSLPGEAPQNDVLAPLWARAKVDSLMDRVRAPADSGDPFGTTAEPARSITAASFEEEITRLGVAYRLLTQYTSFVAVEKRREVKEGKLQTVPVPVELPRGVSRKALPGDVAHGVDRFEVGDAPLDPTELNTQTLTLNARASGTGVSPRPGETYYDDNPVFIEAGGGSLGGLGGFTAGRGGVGVGAGTGFGGRGQGARQAMVGAYGGTRQSERSVAGALNWLARHQDKDGSWSFNASGSSDAARYPDAGKCSSKCGATALALVPFLAAGQTQESRGPYQQHIYRGLHYLMQKQKPNGDLRDEADELTWQAVAALALCEAYGMTKDKPLGKAAQKALDRIAASQDQAGGWARKPGEKPDAITTAWHVLALQSGRSAGLQVDLAVRKKAAAMLDRLQSDGGAFYGRTGPGKDRDATAAGLLCRLDLGWKPGNEPAQPVYPQHYQYHLSGSQPANQAPTPEQAAIQRGALYLVQEGPSKQDLVYTHFATVFLHRLSGPNWDDWNRKMRRLVIESQVKEGPEAGSWWFADEAHAASGGRLFQTAVATLNLEVYYRYLPVYK